MNTSINLYFKNLDTKLKLETIKKLGYVEFFTGIYDGQETLKLIEQINYAKNLGLNCTMIHCDYHDYDLNKLWEEEQIGEDITNKFIKQIFSCEGLTKNFVVHLNDSKDCPVSEIGLIRIKKMLKACEEININLCVENLYSDKEIPYIFSNISHPLLKICYDSGHENFLTKNFKICENYGKFIEVLHIHENNGEQDEHKKLSKGSFVYNKLKKELKLLKKDIVLASEIKIKQDEWVNYLKENYEVLKSL